MYKNIILFLFTIGLILICACGKNKEIITPQLKNITESVYASGIIKSKNQYEVFSKVGGVIKKMVVKEGTFVKKGDVLFEIENPNSQLLTDNARITANNNDFFVNKDKLYDANNAILLAQKKLSSDSLLYQRQKNLWESKVGTKIDLEMRALNVESAKTTLATAYVKYAELKRQLTLASEQSKNNLQIAKTTEGDLIVRSNVEGLVYKVNKEQGEWVTNSMVVVIIGDAKEFIVELNVDENDIAKVKPNQKVFIKMDSYKNQVFEATTTTVEPIMNNQTRTFKVDAVFTQKPEILFPNLTIESNIVIRTQKNVLTIPRNYLLNDSKVMLENETFQNVTTGIMDYNLVEIKSGLDTTTQIRLPEKK